MYFGINLFCNLWRLVETTITKNWIKGWDLWIFICFIIYHFILLAQNKNVWWDFYVIIISNGSRNSVFKFHILNVTRTLPTHVSLCNKNRIKFYSENLNLNIKHKIAKIIKDKYFLIANHIWTINNDIYLGMQIFNTWKSSLLSL